MSTTDTTYQPSPRTAGVIARDKRKKREKKRHKDELRKKLKHTTATLSEATRARLLDEAMHHPLFMLMEPEQVMAFLNERIAEFLRPYPYWYGHLSTDKPRTARPATPEQLTALAKGRQARSDEANDRDQRLNDRLASEAA